MGQIQTRFRRQTRAEILDQLETGIREKEKERLNNGRNQAVVTRFVNIGALGVFSLIVILSLCMLVNELVVILVPVVFMFVRCFISRHYREKLKNSHYELYKMREEKKMVLEDVKSNETYMVAKELLDQYGHPEDHWNSPSPTKNAPDIPENTREIEISEHVLEKGLKRRNCAQCYEKLRVNLTCLEAKKKIKKVKTVCIQCNQFLCLGCFKDKHA